MQAEAQEVQESGVVMHISDPRALGGGQADLLRVQGQPSICSNFPG